MKIWRAGPQDAQRVAELLAAFRNHMGRDWPDDDAFRATVERLIADDRTEYLLGATGEGPAQGVVQLRFRWTIWWSAEDCWLEDLYVLDEARRTGLGRALVEAALELAGERGCRRVDLDVDPENAPARGLYQALGFRDGPQILMRRRV